MKTNPILRGFHPDPSIIRVGEDYFIATSTFEWWPAIRINHSKDLVNWKTYGYALTDPSYLNLSGVGASQGIWAPCLSFHDGIYYLAYTLVHSFYCNMYDTKNFYVTSESILGPWSEPIPLNNLGFDPSLFHDTDGRKYLVSMSTDHRVPKKFRGKLILQELSVIEKRLIGPVYEIYNSNDLFLEGPHIYKRNGWYYLFSADTGTGEGHGQTIQRSRAITGPYEMYHPEYAVRSDPGEAYSIMTTRHDPDYPLQKVGHADLVETSRGEWYAVFLCGRPLPTSDNMSAPRRYPLGRESGIQKVTWTKDNWLDLSNGSILPSLSIDDSDATEIEVDSVTFVDNFDAEQLHLNWQSLRIPMTKEFLSLSDRPGWLRLYGMDGLASKFRQTLIATRWTEFHFIAETYMQFQPEYFKQMAGLICLYDTDNYLYLHMTHDEELGDCISILKAENKVYTYPAGFIPILAKQGIYLMANVNQDQLQFYYRLSEDEPYQSIGHTIDCSFMSDEACNEGWFTGSMVGLCCQDLTGFHKHADFNWFIYRTM
ncbi:MAG: family 43 glycosylhydrolase [Lachnospiraceae bacterium]